MGVGGEPAEAGPETTELVQQPALCIPRWSSGSGRAQKSEKGLVVVGAGMRERSGFRGLSWRK